MSAESRSVVARVALAFASLVLLVGVFRSTMVGPVAFALGATSSVVCAFVLASLVDDRASAPHVLEIAARPIGIPLAVAVGAILSVQASLVLAVSGVLGRYGAGAVVTVAFLGAVVAVYRLVDAARGVVGRSLAFRPSFVAIVLQVVLALPLLGAFGLVDPWETHYAEVAREMVARGDPLSPFWANEGFFRTKPIFDFWAQALVFRATNVHSAPGEMLVGVFGRIARPEWAVRFPSFVMALLGNAVLGHGVDRSFGRREGFFARLVLATSAHFALLGHQSITDMPLVSSVMASFGLWLAGRATPDGARSRSVPVSIFGLRVDLGARRLLLALFFLLVVPQVALLVSRNLDLSVYGARLSMDRIVAGSTGNEALPGQVARAVSQVAFPRLWPLAQGLGWLALALVVGGAVASLRSSRAAQVVAALVVCAPGTLAKGPAGFVFLGAVVVVVALVFDRATLRRSIAPYLVGSAALALIVLPWFVAMHLRHGRAFTDELVMRHMIGRTLEHLHDTNEGDDTSARYYLWQLGYGLFPWTGLVPAALSTWGRARETPVAARARFALVAWALVAFSLVTVMKTKFHHYVFPALPPLAVLVGVELGRVFADDDPKRGSARGALAFVGAVVTAAVGWDFFGSDAAYPGLGQARLMHLFTYMYRRSWPGTLDLRAALAAFTVLAGVATLAFALRARRRVVVGCALAVGYAFALFVLDVYLVRAAPHWGQREIVQAFVGVPDRGDEPLAAYDMNWKGENFYTGNRLAIFLNGRASLGAYLAEHRRAGKKIWIVCEHARRDRLVGEAAREGQWQARALTSPEQNDKFVLLELRALPPPPAP